MISKYISQKSIFKDIKIITQNREFLCEGDSPYMMYYITFSGMLILLFYFIVIEMKTNRYQAKHISPQNKKSPLQTPKSKDKQQNKRPNFIQEDEIIKYFNKEQPVAGTNIITELPAFKQSSQHLISKIKKNLMILQSKISGLFEQDIIHEVQSQKVQNNVLFKKKAYNEQQVTLMMQDISELGKKMVV